MLALARANAIYHTVLGGALLLMMMAVTLRSLRQHHPQMRLPLGWTAVAAILFLLPYFAIAWWVGPELPSIGGAVLGGVGFVALVRIRHAGTTPGNETDQDQKLARVLLASAPYLLLIGLILLTRLVPPIRHSLSGYEWTWQWMEHFRGSFKPLYHPGTMLMAAFLIAACCQRRTVGDIGRAIGSAILQLRMVTLALLVMLSLSRLMVHAGFIETLAVAAAAAAGGAWPLLAPMVGVLGTFVTGSATASNILFSDFQHATASNLQIPTLVIASTQGFGASVGNMICPHNIIAGGATVGIAGQEGVILRRTLLPCLIYTLLGGVLALILARVGGFFAAAGT